MSKQRANERWWHRYVPAVAEVTIPADAAAVFSYLLVATVLLYALPTDAVVVRSLLGFPLLFFVPGFALVAVLFPGDDTRTANPRTGGIASRLPSPTDAGIDWRERLALSFGASIALLPTLALVMSLVGLSYTTATILGTVVVFSAFGMALAVVYRNRVPKDRRFQVPVDRWRKTVGRSLRAPQFDTALDLVLALVVVASMAGIGYALVAPNHAETFTSASLLTENGQGELVASGYPDTLDGGEQFVVRVRNDEQQAVSYTVVAELERVSTDDTGTTVLQHERLGVMNQRVAAGETWTQRHTVQPTMGGENMRLSYYVYKGDPPETPSAETAYRHLWVWVDVPTENGG